MNNTAREDYTNRLVQKSGARWKQFLDVQAPYRWNLRRLNLGFTLDVGCGIGRNLKNLNGNGVGVDHNPTSIDVVRTLGYQAFTGTEFHQKYAGKCPFDSILISHVVEHMTFSQAKEMIESYLPYLKSGGKIVLIAPQTAGYNSDPTHVEFFDEKYLGNLITATGFSLVRSFSFPFPKFVGAFFKYNEFVVVGIKVNLKS